MGHLVQAASQLIDEVRAADPKVKVTIVGDEDGLGFNREVRLEGEGAKDIADALEAAADHRIAELVRSSKGVRVVFVPSTQADYRTPYDLAEALAVLNED